MAHFRKFVAICIFHVTMSSCSEKDPFPKIATIVASHYRTIYVKRLTEGNSKKISLLDLISEMDIDEATLVEKYRDLIITPDKRYLDSFPRQTVFIIVGSGELDFIVQENGIVVSQPKVTAGH